MLGSPVSGCREVMKVVDAGVAIYLIKRIPFGKRRLYRFTVIGIH